MDKRFPYVIGMLFVIFKLTAARSRAKWHLALTRELQEVTFLSVTLALWYARCPYLVSWLAAVLSICWHAFMTAHGNTHLV